MKKYLAVTRIFVLVSFLLITQFNSALAQEGAEGTSLYDRLGGAYTIAGVIDDFIDRLFIDPIITANKKVAAEIGRINKAGLKYLLTEMVCEESGGPQKYTGRSMKESHEHMNITEAEWLAMVKDFLATLKKFNVLEKEQNELLAIVGSTKKDIVKAPAEEPALKAREVVPGDKAQAAPPAEPPAAKKEEAPAAPEPEIPGLEDLPEPVE